MFIKNMSYILILIVLSSSVYSLFGNTVSILDISTLGDINISMNISNKEEVFCLQGGDCTLNSLSINNQSINSTINTSLDDYVPYTGTDSNLNMGLFNITANWFKGIFNWIIGDNSQEYLDFNGTHLDFNETKLNETIDDRATGGGSESDPIWVSERYNKVNVTIVWNNTLNAEVWKWGR